MFIHEKTFRDRGSRLVFVMGLFDFFKKKKPSEKETLDFIKDLRTKAKEFKDLDNLVFKSNQAAFEYTEKFFSSYKIDTKSAYHGIMTTPGIAYISVEHKGKPIRTMVNVNVHPDCTSKIDQGDFVLIGISDLGKKLITVDELDKIIDDTKDAKQMAVKLANTVVRDSPKGFVLYKLKLELDLKTNQFKRY